MDVIGRVGGEEFMVLLPDANLDISAVIAERIRGAVEKMPVMISGTPLHITVSIGVAQFLVDGDTLDTILGAADERLYKAKRSGRNRVSVGDDIC